LFGIGLALRKALSVFLVQPSDTTWGVTPSDPRNGTLITNWARGNYGAVEEGTDGDHTVNGSLGLDNNPFPGTSKRGVMGNNFSVNLGQVTDGLSNTAIFAEMRVGLLSIDGRGTWAIGMSWPSLCCETRPFRGKVKVKTKAPDRDHDYLEGKFGPATSPIVRTADKSTHLTIDLDKPAE
jgi:Protein of unknown function (DUF1559)